MHIDEEIRAKFELLINDYPQSMRHALGIKFSLISRDEMRASMPVNENTIQPMGILHGGASVALSETLASIGAWLNLSDENSIAVGLEINANHIKSVQLGGSVIGISKPIHRGSTTQVWETRIETDDGKLVSISRCTIAIIKKRG